MNFVLLICGVPSVKFRDSCHMLLETGDGNG